MPTPANMPQRRPQMGRETFQAFARANSREALMDAMRSQAEAYFGGPVELKEASAQPGPQGGQASYQGTSRWCARAPRLPLNPTDCTASPERTNP